MFNPVEFSLKIQQVAMESAAASARMMAANYLRFIEQQSHLLELNLSGRRNEDERTSKKPHKSSPRKTRKKVKKGKKSPCSGPDLLDHYGKRSHDVDVEHI
jgi:hypothetical protein